jgi:LuxR family maltose regulon positive regulatory protein
VSVLEPLSRAADPASASPLVPPATGKAVVRTALLNRLCSTGDGTIVTIVAPAGFGKTTLLAQWAERDRRPVLWLDLEPEDDDPEILEPRIDELAGRPGVLTLVDDVHVLRSPAALAALERLLGQTSDGTSFALAARRPSALPLARLRAEGRLLEIGMDELTLKDREAETLLRRAGVLLPRQETAALAERLEGWPAALYLAALSVRSGAQASTMGGDDRFLADYLDTEHLACLSSAQRKFALQTSVLAELTSEECDSLLARSDSAQMLDSLERAGVAAPLDHQRRRYRYPRIVRDLLSRELERSEPERARALHRAAAGRAVEIGALEQALEHAAAAGDVDRVAEFAERLAVSACGRGRLDALERWLDLVHDDDVENHPDLCIAASWLAATARTRCSTTRTLRARHSLRDTPGDRPPCSDEAQPCCSQAIPLAQRASWCWRSSSPPRPERPS